MIFRFILTFFLLYLLHATLYAQEEYSIFQRDGRFGVKNSVGQELVAPIYDQIGWSNDNSELFRSQQIGYKENDKWGLLTIQGKRLTEPIFYHLEKFSDTEFKIGVTQGLSNRLMFGLLNSKGKTVLSCNYFVLESLAGCYLIGENNENGTAYGLLDHEYKEVLPVNFLNIEAIGKVLLASPNGMQWFVFSLDGSLVTSQLVDQYKVVGDFLEVQKKGAKGLIDLEDGKVLFDIKYKSFTYTANGPSANESPNWQILDRSLNVKLELDADSVIAFEDSFIGYLNAQERIYRDTLETFADSHITIKQATSDLTVIEEKNGGSWKAFNSRRELATGDSIYFDGLFFHILNQNQWTLMNRYGRIVTSRSVQATKPSQEQYVPVKMNNQWGLIDYKGEEVLGFAYDFIGSGFGNNFPVKYVGSWGIIDALGNWVVQPSYDSLYRISNFYIGDKAEHKSIISSQGVHLSVTSGTLAEKENGPVEITDIGKKGMISSTGTLVFYPVYISTSYKGRFYLGKKSEGSVVKNSNGEFILRLEKGYEEVHSWNEGYFHIQKRGLHGFVDESGRLRVANRYDSARGFNEGKAAIKLIGKWGFIDKSERLVIQPLYEYVSDFRNGLAIVKSGKYGIVDDQGAKVLNLEFDNIRRTRKGSYIIDFGNKKGLVDVKGGILLSPSFDYMEDIGSDLIVVGSGGRKAIYRSDGVLLKSFEYEEVKVLGQYLAVKK